LATIACEKPQGARAESFGICSCDACVASLVFLLKTATRASQLQELHPTGVQMILPCAGSPNDQERVAADLDYYSLNSCFPEKIIRRELLYFSGKNIEPPMNADEHR